MTCLRLSRQFGEFLNDLNVMVTCVQASVGTVHCAVQNYASIKDVIYASRGFTMAAMTRKPPHAFNFLRQAEVLAKAGTSIANQFQDQGLLSTFWTQTQILYDML